MAYLIQSSMQSYCLVDTNMKILDTINAAVPELPSRVNVILSAVTAGLAIGCAMSGHTEYAFINGGVAIGNALCAIQSAIEETTQRARPNAPKTSHTSRNGANPLRLKK